MIEQEDELQKDELTVAYIAGCHDTRKAYEQRLAEAESKIPKWIPVKERLPKPGATVLAVDNSGDMGVCTFVNAKFIGECFGFEAYLNDGGWDCSASKVIGEYVTHWMTPEPPANGKGGIMSEEKQAIEKLLTKIVRLEQRLAETEAKLPRWIPVGERLPEGREGVLVCLDNTKVRYGYHLNGGWYEYTVPIESYGETVTHWMPRPDKPETERKGE